MKHIMHATSCLQILRVSVRDSVQVSPFNPSRQLPGINLLYGDIGHVTDRPIQKELQATDIIEKLLRDFKGQVSCSALSAFTSCSRCGSPSLSLAVSRGYVNHSRQTG